MLIQYMQIKIQANLWLTHQCLLWGMFQVKGLEKTQFHEAGLQKVSTSLSIGINVTGNVCSEASPEE